MGVIPMLGARLAQLTFEPELLVTDGEATVLAPDADGGAGHHGRIAEGWIPFRDVFTLLAAGKRHVMMGASQLDQFGNQNISCIGPWARPKAQLIGVRGAPGNTVNHPASYWVPKHSRRVFVEHVDMVSGVGYQRAAALSPQIAGFHELRQVVTEPGGAGLRRRRARDAAAVGASRRLGLGRRRRDRLRAGRPAGGAGDQAADRRRACPHPGAARSGWPPGPGTGMTAGPAARPGPARPGATRPARPDPLPTRLTALTGIRYPIVQTGMGFVAGAQARGGDFAGRRPGHHRLRDHDDATRCGPPMAEVKQRTDAPFGVNLRADAPDAAERVELIISAGVRVASFALAPKREQIQRLKDAGVVVIPSVGARRHAEKVAQWGADAVMVQGGEGGGHTGPIPTSLLLPQVVSAVDIPVVAAGGFFDGRGLVAALAYGAEGIAMGTRFLLTTDSPVADAVKQVYLSKSLTDTVVTTRVDGVPHRVLRSDLVDGLERSGHAAGLLRAVRNAAAFRSLSGLSWREMLREGAAMRRGSELGWSQVIMAANTPMLLKAAMVDGRPISA